ncbi:MAG: low temperature requirement protein A [Polyangiaceae bacterium]|nr:low temperature requirement protein A [Polyangiaceae bacterium]
MQSRWFHQAVLWTPRPGHERKVGWLELFYDLVYVAALIQLGTALASHVSWFGALAFAGLMIPLWFTWTGFTFYNNRFQVDDAAHRLLVFGQMLAIGAVAASVPKVLDGQHQTFALAYGAARLAVVAMYARAHAQVPEARGMTRRYGIGFALGAAVWLASAFVPPPWAFFLWAVAQAVDLSTPLGKNAIGIIERFPIDFGHVSERYAILVLIVLGEGFVKVLSELAERGVTPETGTLSALGLLVTCTIWWIYFDDVAGARLKARRLGSVLWVYGHLPLAVAVTAVGVSLKKAATMGLSDIGSAKYRWLFCGSLALALAAVGFIDHLTERRESDLPDGARVSARLVSAVLVLALGVVGGFVPTFVWLGLIAVVCVAQVVFDISTSPRQADHHAHVTTRSSEPPELAAPAPGAKRWDPGDAVRRGAPSALRRDLYVYFMEGSWWRLFGACAFAYSFGNLVFASLYLLDPGGIANAAPRSFLDAYFFSVQTMATIGYGALHPASTFTNVLVTVEAALSLVSVAVVTGLIFAKLARPRSGVLFSNVMTVEPRQGKPTLMFRVANARGNDVVEASIRVTVLRDEVTPEGHKLRRLYELPLERSTQPLFTLSWLVMHVVGDDSPMRDITPENAHDKVRGIVCTLMGHDGTYGTTTYARKSYYPEEIRFGHRFVDVISDLPDGRLAVDYDKFSETTAI